MRNVMRGLVMGALLMASVAGAGAQVVDPTTGLTVDAASDPVDFTAVVSGQPGNAGMEANFSAMAAMNASMQASQQASDAAAQANDAMNAVQAAPKVPALPSTPKPVIGPKASTFAGAGMVTIADADAAAKIFYTVNGTKPTASSAIYAAPISVSAKMKVQALAWDVNERPSRVASRTFKVKN